MAYGESNVTCPMTSRDAKCHGCFTLLSIIIMYLLSIRGTKVTTTEGLAYNIRPYCLEPQVLDTPQAIS